MRKLVAGFAVSLDGYIEGPAGEYDWIVSDPSVDFAAQMAAYDTFLYGRKTYEKMASYGAGLAAWQNYVFSRTLAEVSEGFILVNDNVGQTITTLKEREGKKIALYGGASLLASLLDLQLVDEISMTVIPILLGSGKPMVAILGQRVPLELTGTKTFPNGNVQLDYIINY
jgi:dihydrofolate reductase